MLSHSLTRLLVVLMPLLFFRFLPSKFVCPLLAMPKGKSICSLFSRVLTAEDGKSCIPETFDKSIEMAPLINHQSSAVKECVNTSSIEGDAMSCGEGATLLLTKKQRNAHQKFALDIKGTTGLDLSPAPSNNGRMVSQCCTCLNANTTTFIRNVRERWGKHAKICPGIMLLRKNSLLAPAQLSVETQAFAMHVMAGGESVHEGVCTQLENHLKQIREAAMNTIIIEQDINNRRTIDSFHNSRGIFTVHCICHRLALVLTDVIKGTRNVEKVIRDRNATFVLFKAQDVYWSKNIFN